MSNDSKKWVHDLFEIHREEQRRQSVHNELKLNEDRAFKNLLPEWTDQLKSEIRKVVDYLNAEMAQDGRVHAVQINESASGVELFTSDLPLYTVAVNADAHAVEFGFNRGDKQRLRLEFKDNAIVSRFDGVFGGSAADYVLKGYLTEAIKKIT